MALLLQRIGSGAIQLGLCARDVSPCMGLFRIFMDWASLALV